MSTESFPFNLYKTNLELQLRIMQLLQDNRQRWLENSHQRNIDAIAKTKKEIEGLSQVADLQSFVTLHTNTAGHLLQTSISNAQAMHEIAIKTQTEFATGLQQALQDWQRGIAQILGNTQTAPWLQNSIASTGQSVGVVKQRKTTERT